MPGELKMTVNLDKWNHAAADLSLLPGFVASRLAAALTEIGRYDIEKLRDNPGKLRIRAKGLKNSFKFKATTPGKATDLSKLFLVEYTGWKAADIFQTGGTVQARNAGSLTVLTDAARGPSGKRRWTQQQLRQQIAQGKMRMFKRPNGEMLIVQDKGGLTKTGKGRKGTAVVLIAVLKNRVVLQKRLNFYENFTANESIHDQLLEGGLEDALKDVAAGAGR